MLSPRITFAIVALAVTFPLFAAGVKPIAVEKPDRKAPVDFEKEILPVLNASCLACHNKTKPKGGLVLESPADIRKGGDAGPAVVAGKPGDSLLMKSASHADADVEIMPPAGNKVNATNLTPKQLGLIALWIEQGATGEVKGPAPLAWRTVADRVKPIYAVAVTKDGSLAAAGRGNVIELFDLKSNKPLATLTDPAAGANVAHRDLVNALAFSPDGRTLASGAFREVKLWTRTDPSSESAEWKLGSTLGTGGHDSPIADRVNALDFTSDGDRLAAASGVPSRTGQAILFSVKSGKVERSLDELHSDSILSLQFSADGKRLVTGSADKFVRLVNVEDGKVLRGFEGHTHHVLGVSLRKDGKVIASAGADNALRFWDAETGERRKQNVTAEKEFTSVRYAGDGESVVACAGDGRVRLYKDSGQESKNLPGAAGFMYAAAATADGKLIVAGGQDGVVRVWSSEGKSVATFDATK